MEQQPFLVLRLTLRKGGRGTEAALSSSRSPWKVERSRGLLFFALLAISRTRRHLYLRARLDSCRAQKPVPFSPPFACDSQADMLQTAAQSDFPAPPDAREKGSLATNRQGKGRHGMRGNRLLSTPFQRDSLERRPIFPLFPKEAIWSRDRTTNKVSREETSASKMK